MSDSDIYRSDLAKNQLAYDKEDHRRSLYTNTKPDHPENERTGSPCGCDRGDTAWEKNGVAMRVKWPAEPERFMAFLDAQDRASAERQREQERRLRRAASRARGRSR